LIALVAVLLLSAVAIAVKPSGERQGSKPNTGVFGQCGEDAQCNDNNPCTTDSCDLSTEPGFCVNDPYDGGGHILDPCLEDADCNDGSPCTIDSCDFSFGGSIGACVNAHVNDGESCSGGVCCDGDCIVVG